MPINHTPVKTNAAYLPKYRLRSEGIDTITSAMRMATSTNFTAPVSPNKHRCWCRDVANFAWASEVVETVACRHVPKHHRIAWARTSCDQHRDSRCRRTVRAQSVGGPKATRCRGRAIRGCDRSDHCRDHVATRRTSCASPAATHRSTVAAACGPCCRSRSQHAAGTSRSQPLTPQRRGVIAFV